ncbi:EthD domain-containing protein [Novosphingobium sp. YJ-S2-02]|uniref:EthD domain-containing protein n=1 Tax=Novosphingobium aureum TaxID=2792964 RepID=A0A931HFV6_9SPHN|nr:EthD domain-containing protein [Novosphingobium aureum]MBH0114591.1 EthD domain-containing protein [Novosphingobium aureum]
MSGALARDAAVPKALLLLKAGEESDTALDALAHGLAGRTGTQLWRALPPGVLGDSPQGEAVGAGLAFDFAVEIDGAHEPSELADLALPKAIAREAGVAVIGTEHHVMPGEGAVALFCPLRRLPGLTGEGFRDYWLNRHADFGRANPESRYRQLHPDPQASDDLCAALGLPACDIDGVAEAYFRDIDELRAVLASPDIAGDAFADEQRFIDHARSAFLPFERIAFA